MVFPFMENHTLYLLAGLFELSVAIICLLDMRSSRADYAMVIFVVAMLWYRWALYFTGGEKSCDCLGILALAMHLSKTQEKVIPIVVLALLSAIVISRLYCKSRLTSLFKNRTTRNGVMTAVVLLVMTLAWYSNGQETAQVMGKYTYYHYDVTTGEPRSNSTRQVAFTCTFSGNCCSLFATNIGLGEGQRTPWEGLIFDGTNTYTFMPYHVEAEGRTWTTETPMGKGCEVRTTISPGPLFLRDYDEFLDFGALWIAYGISPKNIATNNDGIIDIPTPWYNTRNHPWSYGDEWKITPSADGRFILKCEMVANTNLDLSFDQEILRPTFNYPLMLSLYNRDKELLGLRREQFPQGFVEYSYRVADWYKTNDFQFPMAAEAVRMQSRWRTNFPMERAIIKASAVTLAKRLGPLLQPVVAQRTFVADYRYTRTNEYSASWFLGYVLMPGESWKAADDPKLLHQADLALRDGIDKHYGGSRKRSSLTWLLLALLLAPLIILLKSTINKNQK